MRRMEQATTRNFIPKEYEFAHEYCFFLHDTLANIVIEGEQAGIFNYQFELKNSDHIEHFSGKSGEELAEWMEQNGYEAEFREVTQRQICVALLSDFSHFIYEALSCSQKGKLTVTFALLRKPLKENLFYFEWLLADPPDFIKRFHEPILSNKERPLPLPTELTKSRRIEIIRKAISNSKIGAWISPEFIYELRYDKKCDYGFERLFQRATHLITTFTAQTEEQNFNFVFSGETEKLLQWQGLYTLLPALLLHTLLIIGTVIRSFDEEKLEDFDLLSLRATTGFLLYLQNGPWTSEITPELNNFLRSLTNAEIPCLGCQDIIDFDETNLHNLYYEGIVECHKCGYKTLLTSSHELLLLGHLVQGQINCPNCNAAVLASEENLASLVDIRKITCQECREEIELITGENA